MNTKNISIISAKELTNRSIVAKDGEIGKCKDVLLNSDQWKLIYLIVDTGSWLTGKKVLLSNHSMNSDVLSESDSEIHVHVTKEQVQDSPELQENEPISRRYEQELFTYYTWPYYWNDAAVFSSMTQPVSGLGGMQDTIVPEVKEPTNVENKKEQYLHSVEALLHYGLSDGKEVFGSIDDVFFNVYTCEIHYFVVNIGGLINRQLALMPTSFVNDISVGAQMVYADINMDLLRHAPSIHSSEDIVSDDIHSRIQAYY